MDKKIVFLHIPKTAGTSVHRMLKDTFGDDKCCPQHLLGPRAEIMQKGYDKQFRVFSGHFNRTVVSNLVWPKFVFTFLRDPVDRIISLFNFWRSHTHEQVQKAPTLLGPRLARENSFYDFLCCKHDVVQCAVNNTYGATFTHFPFIEYAKRVDMFSAEEENIIVKDAVSYLGMIDCVGILEHLRHGTPKELQLLGLDSVVPKERTKELIEKTLDFPLLRRDELDAKTLELLAHLTRIDQNIYDCVLKAKNLMRSVS